MVSYTNALSYYNSQQLMDAAELGWVDTVLRGVPLLSLLPMVPSSHFMRDEFYEKSDGTTKITQQRKLNEEPDAKQKNRFTKRIEKHTVFHTHTDIDRKLAKRKPQQLDLWMEMDAEDMIVDVAYELVNGVPTPDGYGLQGLANRIAIGDAFDINNSGTLDPASSSANFKTFLGLVRAARDKIKAGVDETVVMLVNQKMNRAISAGRDQLGANAVGYGVFDIMNQRVNTVDGIPVVQVFKDSAGNEVLPFAENSESSCSIWLMSVSTRINEGSNKLPGGVCLTVSSEMIFDAWVQEIGTQFKGYQDFEVGLRTPQRSVARISRLVTSVA